MSDEIYSMDLLTESSLLVPNVLSLELLKALVLVVLKELVSLLELMILLG
jgi:hypothetical protein